MITDTTIVLSPQLRLQLITAEDHAQHLALMQRIYPPAFAYLWPDGGAWYINHVHRKAALLADLAVANAPYYHVYHRGALRGILRLKRESACPDHPDLLALKLDRLYLDDAVRGQGIGTTLIDYCKQLVRQQGACLLWLERMDTNAATIGFYQKNGFKPGGRFRLTFAEMYPHFRGMQRLWWRVPT